ncbi:hypothetical protein [Comamonas terrigena]|uniref:hypothetical protein n=1 Tax=Comamonas terrigena TaxID=32013 RepID=UPI00235201B9|nr:hypothetical protein [Comamonas terrigena]
MENICKITILAFTLLSFSGWAASDEGFQGLAWGASISSIKKKFPKATQEIVQENYHPICENSDGTARLCTVSQQSCERFGILCHPSLSIKEYMVGSYPFDIEFALSKNSTLDAVSLTYSGTLKAKNKSIGKQIFEHLMDSLTKKYGQPINSEYYTENRAGFIGGQQKWQTTSSRINLNYHGQFDENQKIVRATITIIYSPLNDDFSSKL